MYSIETTAGFIIDSRNHGEAGKILSIFTRELGLVRTVAQGLRLEKSKLRYHAQVFDLAVFSLVRGKDIWRLTNASEYPDFSSRITNIKAQELVARLAQVMRRLLHGEEKHVELFDQVVGFLEFIQSNSDLGTDDFLTFESIVMFRILHLLGYVGKDISIGPEIIIGKIDRDLLIASAGKRSSINAHVNKALKESQL